MTIHRCAALATLVFALGCVQETRFRMTMLASDPQGGGDDAISRDGNRLLVSSHRGGNWDLWSYDRRTAAWSQMTTDPAEDIEGQWSPDGTAIAFTSTRTGNKDIWILSIESGSLRRMTDSPDDDEYPAWSPDGRFIVYTGGPWKSRDFFLAEVDGSERRKLTDRPGQAGACSFAPDNQFVVCHRYDTGSGAIERIPLEGGSPVSLTSGASWDYKPTVSPDGKWLAFSRATESPSAIWLMPLAGGQPRPLAQTGHDDRWPSWTGQSDALSFHRIVETGKAIRAFDRSTGEVKTIVGPDESPLQSSLDPEGRHVVYCADLGGRKRLRVLDLAGGAIRTLDTGPGDACFPRWSPAGDQIAFVVKEGNRWEVATVRPDGQGMQTWTRCEHGIRGMDGPVDWSPDGKKITFHADTQPFEADILVVDTTTGGITNLTHDDWFDEAPSWTSDGKGILFMSTRGGDWTWGLFRLSVEDGKVEKISETDYVEKNYPRMGVDGSIVWSTRDKAGAEVLAEVTPKDPVRVLSGAGTGARWPSYSRDGRTLVFTTIEHHVEYWLTEGLFAPDSPLTSTPRMQGAPERRRCDVPSTPHQQVHLSPVSVHHR